jgi:hypothetical protein
MGKSRAVRVDFGNAPREWDGFGVNYVEMTHSRDGRYEDYGSFSLMAHADRERVLELIFGPDGLRPGLVKMFLNPYLLGEPPTSGALDLDAYRFDRYMPQTLRFAREGVRRVAEWGGRLRFYAGHYGPPAWATRQKVVRGRDLDPAMKEPLALYLLGCVKGLREREGVPVEAIGLHNEGEAGGRWPDDPRHDFNMYWPPEQVADFLSIMGDLKGDLGLADLKLCPGETTLWSDFRPYAESIAAAPDALAALGLITSHGFGKVYDAGAIELLRARRPGLHAWTTSTSWLKEGGVEFAVDFADQVRLLGLNGLIPWAAVQRVPYWPGGDPNPNPPVLVREEDGRLGVEVRAPYHYYKQLTRAGQPGTAVAEVEGDGDELRLLAFADNGSGHGDAVAVMNAGAEEPTVEVTIAGSDGPFGAWRTSPSEQFAPLGEFGLDRGAFRYTAPPESVTTFFSRPPA